MSKTLEWYRDGEDERIVKWCKNTDREIAGWVEDVFGGNVSGMQSRCQAAHDRILALSQNREKLEKLLEAAKYLIFAATAQGMPADWNKTRDEWLALVADEGIDTV